VGYVEDLRKLVGHRPLIFVGAVTIIEDKEGRILLQQRRFPIGKWGIPGGLMELGESTEEVARREVLEETGLTIGVLRLINVYSGKDHFIRAENGDEFYVVTVAYHTNEFSGELMVDLSESIKFEFFHPHELPKNMVGSHLTMIQEFVKGRSK
jgi:8-oxo-dGTP pyrophosphatase MutT (NUDIX family)